MHQGHVAAYYLDAGDDCTKKLAVHCARSACWVRWCTAWRAKPLQRRCQVADVLLQHLKVGLKDDKNP